MAAAVFLTVTFLFCTVQSQIFGPGPIFPGPWGIDGGPCGPCATEIYGPCGNCGHYGADPYGPIPTLPNLAPIPQSCAAPAPCGPILNNIAPSFIQNQIPAYPNLINQSPCPQPIYTNVPLHAPVEPQSATTPAVSTTIVDNSLANSLANAIQLLIVSNLIENTLGSSSASGNALAQCLGFLDNPCINNFDILSPGLNPSQNIPCEYPVLDSTYSNNCPCFQEHVSYPCSDISSCSNFGSGVGSSFPVLGDCNSLGCDNNGPNQIFASNPFSFGSVVPSFGCLEPAVAAISPIAVEVPFPAAIPAQLTCNFGYLPTNVPCVSVNVEPLPFDGCNNLFGNLGNNFFY